jgi:hypothetical protein
MAGSIRAVIAIDTNLLVYAHRTATTEHAAAQQAIEKAASHDDGWGISLPCMAEFWSIVTHVKSPKPSTGDEAAAFIRSLVSDGGAEIWRPVKGFWRRLSGLATNLNVCGVRIFDLQIALIALENGAHELWSHDKNFTEIPGLVLRDPLIPKRK